MFVVLSVVQQYLQKKRENFKFKIDKNKSAKPWCGLMFLLDGHGGAVYSQHIINIQKHIFMHTCRIMCTLGNCALISTIVNNGTNRSAPIVSRLPVVKSRNCSKKQVRKYLLRNGWRCTEAGTQTTWAAESTKYCIVG